MFSKKSASTSLSRSRQRSVNIGLVGNTSTSLDKSKINSCRIFYNKRGKHVINIEKKYEKYTYIFTHFDDNVSIFLLFELKVGNF
jgi:hypothetical protein